MRRWITAWWMIIILGVVGAVARELPVEVKLLMYGQQQMEPKVAVSGMGWATGGQFSFLHGKRFATNLRITFDHMTLEEDSVLLEWDWPYWDERYIDWMLTGASQEEVDSISTLGEYWRPDSSYHGVFNPYQWVQEVKASIGFQYRQPLTQKLSLYGEVGLGFSRYKRRLKMVEDWWKTFVWEWDSSMVANSEYSDMELSNYETFRNLHDEDPETYQFSRIYSEDGNEVTYHYEYEYYTRVTHFAPNKKGVRFFVTPVVGLRYRLTRTLDVDLAYHGVWYLEGDFIDTVNDWFCISDISITDFPLKSKHMLSLGLTFKY